MARGNGDHLEGAHELAQRVLGERAEERQRRHQRQLRARRLPVVTGGGVEDLRGLREERGAGEERAEGLEALEVWDRRGRRIPILPPRPSQKEGGRQLVELLVDVDAERRRRNRPPPPPPAGGCRRVDGAVHRQARSPRSPPPASPICSRRRQVMTSELGIEASRSTTAALQRSAASTSSARRRVRARSDRRVGRLGAGQIRR